jgi:alpha-galactosidase
MAPVTIEAEASANTLGGTARVATYTGASGGRVVMQIGDWGGRENDGTLRVNNVTVPAAATYRLTIWFVNVDTFDGQNTHTLLVTVDGRTTSVTATSGASCCVSTAVTVTFAKGANSVTFANPSSRAPAIDKVVVSSA